MKRTIKQLATKTIEYFGKDVTIESEDGKHTLKFLGSAQYESSTRRAVVDRVQLFTSDTSPLLIEFFYPNFVTIKVTRNTATLLHCGTEIMKRENVDELIPALKNLLGITRYEARDWAKGGGLSSVISTGNRKIREACGYKNALKAIRAGKRWSSRKN